jgi:hypothetical protein
MKKNSCIILVIILILIQQGNVLCISNTQPKNDYKQILNLLINSDLLNAPAVAIQLSALIDDYDDYKSATYLPQGAKVLSDIFTSPSLTHAGYSAFGRFHYGIHHTRFLITISDLPPPLA